MPASFPQNAIQFHSSVSLHMLFHLAEMLFPMSPCFLCLIKFIFYHLTIETYILWEAFLTSSPLDGSEAFWILHCILHWINELLYHRLAEWPWTSSLISLSSFFHMLKVSTDLPIQWKNKCQKLLCKLKHQASITNLTINQKNIQYSRWTIQFNLRVRFISQFLVPTPRMICIFLLLSGSTKPLCSIFRKQNKTLQWCLGHLKTH